jgi:hypothetical protein
MASWQLPDAKTRFGEGLHAAPEKEVLAAPVLSTKFLSAVTFGEWQRGMERTRVQNRIKDEVIESWVVRRRGAARIHGLVVATKND